MTRKLILAALLFAALPAVALAQNSSRGNGPVATAWGPRFGLSSGPDQVLVGAQLDLGNLAPDLTLSPNVDIGLGDHLTTFSVSGDVHYHFRVERSPWRPYVGGGLTFIHTSFDLPPGTPSWVDNSSTDLGASILGGAIVPTQSGSRFFVEAKLGLGDVHDFKLLAGWNFAL